MYSTCLFCNASLGHNEAIERFPVGRRLAFDAARGRLWVVCRKCERWNLTPLEERWEAIEECERAFSTTRMRVSTPEIGLARLREGLELVRIGEPQRPELAAWRYGDQFGRRRRKRIALVAGGLAAGGLAFVAGPMMGLIGFGAFSPTLNLLNGGMALYRARTHVHIPDPAGGTFATTLAHLPKTRIGTDDGELVVKVHGAMPDGPTATPFFRYRAGEVRELRGEAAIRAAGAILPRLNASGGARQDVQRAVSLLEETPDVQRLFVETAHRHETRRTAGWGDKGHLDVMRSLPAPQRLALEMAAHEDVERRALEGELHLLESAWRDAEEIAAIADDMFLPASVDEQIARLRRDGK